MSPLEKAARALWTAQRDRLIAGYAASETQLTSWEEMDASQRDLLFVGLRAALEALMEPFGEQWWDKHLDQLQEGDVQAFGHVLRLILEEGK
jgi:hypothetical protein